MDELKVGDSVKVVSGEFQGAYGIIELIELGMAKVSRAGLGGEVVSFGVALSDCELN